MGKQKILNEVQIKENNKVKELTNFEIEKINNTTGITIKLQIPIIINNTFLSLSRINSI